MHMNPQSCEGPHDKYYRVLDIDPRYLMGLVWIAEGQVAVSRDEYKVWCGKGQL
jgi:hypothetical protein